MEVGAMVNYAGDAGGGYTTPSTAAAALCEADGSHGPIVN